MFCERTFVEFVEFCRIENDRHSSNTIRKAETQAEQMKDGSDVERHTA